MATIQIVRTPAGDAALYVNFEFIGQHNTEDEGFNPLPDIGFNLAAAFRVPLLESDWEPECDNWCWDHCPITELPQHEYHDPDDKTTIG